MSHLVVFGATGAAGRRVAALAADAGVEAVLVARRREPLEALAQRFGHATRVAEIEPRALDAAFAGAGVVISCAGPYTHFGPPVLAAAIRAGAHYVDSTGEPRWVQRIADTFEPAAIAAGVAAIPSLGLGAATDLAASVAADGLGGIRRVTAGIRIVGMRPSAATARSTVELVAGGAPIVTAGRTAWERPGRRTRAFHTGRGALFPSPDAIVLGRAFPHATIAAHMQGPVPVATAGGLGLACVAWRSPRARRGTLRAIEWLDRRGLSDHAGGGRSRVTVVVEGDAGSRCVIGTVDDIYEITGRSLFAVAQALLAGAAVTGLQPAGAVLGDPREAARELGVGLAYA